MSKGNRLRLLRAADVYYLPKNENASQKVDFNPLEVAKVLSSSKQSVTMTNAKKVAVWKNPPGQPNSFVFDKVVNL